MTSVFFLSSCFFLPREEDVLPPPLIEPESAQYQTVEVRRDNLIQRVDVVGNLISTSRAELSFNERGGYLETLNVRIGDQVRRGQVLAELDSDQLRSDIRQAEMKSELYRRQIDNLEARIELETRMEEILLQELVSNYELHSRVGDLPERDLLAIERDIEKQRLSMDLKMNQQDEARLSITHSLELNQLRLGDLRRQLEATQLRAPIGGAVVFLDSSEVGRYIRAQEPFIRISSPEDLLVQYTGREFQRFSRGMKVLVQLAAEEYTGRVVSTPQDFPGEEYQANRETVRIRVDDLPSGLDEGSAADISGIIATRENVLILPKAVIQRFQARRYVRILEDGIIREQDVSLGIESDRFYEITGGLKEGQTVLF